MTAQTARQQTRRGRNLQVGITRCPQQIEAAQRLRYRVFSEEYGSDLGATTPGLDADHYDTLCDHLIVTDEDTGQLVATTRILHQNDTAGTGGFYSAGEFDLASLARLPGTIAELGRTCVHPDYRNGGTISLLWAAVAEYLVERQVSYLIGCASISMADGGGRAWRIARHLQQTFLSGPESRVTPRRPLPYLAHPGQDVDNHQTEDIPALIRAYMRLGAKVCGEPCWDPEFRCADVLVLLEVSNLSRRYSRHFLGTTA
jgi:putative hemolysin